ncbi:mycothiol synthase [Frankia sp. AgB32]|uniref:mycothiol synthase n=1 Tax=Frankia sp. AgB32 TaxID=631119 RepID=UPI00200C6FD2|nr:mycothiol synthase [Frankia sp. AgB32]MCK9894763.1 mycothiol synthase [Frankia sp. AgB32]
MTSLTWRPTLSGADVDDIENLLAAAEHADGTGPVSEDVRLTLRPGLRLGTGRHLLAVGTADAPAAGPRGLVGYAHLGGVPGEGQAELVVHPDHRRRGVGTALATALTEAAGSAPMRLDVWAHGDLPAAASLADRLGFARTRVLFQLRRPLAAGPALPPAEPPAGITLRTYQPGRDDEAWLAVNAAAFADHPEQGRWTLDDLTRRQAEPWFDPKGFFVAERDGHLVGFHWTKIHEVDPMPPAGRPAGPIGEVYVVGVRPGAGGAGLGRALTLAGLGHLRDQGLDSVLLYVDEDNDRAVRMYCALGFSTYTRDVSYHWTGSAEQSRSDPTP